MILVLGVWTFLRALLGSSAVVTLENVALRHQLAVLQVRPAPSAVPPGPYLLGLACTPLDRLAVEPGYRPARHRPRLAPLGLPAPLALEITSRCGRTPADR